MTAMPDWIVPMAATLTQDRFTDPSWTFERKLDGIRLLAFKRAGAVTMYSRNRLPQNHPPIAAAIASLPASELILDGELTWDAGGVSYHVFDLVWIDGRDLAPLALTDRRALLSRLPLRAPLRHVAAVGGPEPWERACREGWEGVIAKRLDSRYEHRRSPHWLKMKCELIHDFVIGGFTDPQGGRRGLGALLVGYFDAGGLAFAGKVGTGFDARLLVDMRRRLDAIEIPAPPFTAARGLPRLRAHWVRPEIVVRVGFIEWTAHDKLRHSRLLGVRADRVAGEVVRRS
jgi:ATP-dependent DNA ligase